MVISYMDEAGHFDSPTSLYVGMAGFVAEEDRWNSLVDVWQKLMSKSRLTRPFHMKDFAHRKGEFKGWSEHNRQFLLGILLDVIQTIKPIPVASIVSISDFRSLTPTQQSMLRSPYHICLQTCTHGSTVLSDLRPENNVRMVFAENVEYGAVQSSSDAHDRQQGNAARLWNAIKAKTIYGPLMDSCVFGSPAEMPGLQVADIFAYELRKEFEAQQLRPDAPMRWAMREILRLADADYAMIRLFNREELLRLILESGIPDKTGTEEVPDVDRQLFCAQRERAEWIRSRTAEFDALHPHGQGQK
jgi:hypothetical protein